MADKITVKYDPARYKLVPIDPTEDMKSCLRIHTFWKAGSKHTLEAVFMEAPPLSELADVGVVECTASLLSNVRKLALKGECMSNEEAEKILQHADFQFSKEMDTVVLHGEFSVEELHELLQLIDRLKALATLPGQKSHTK